MDLHLTISDGFVSFKIYDKHNDFDFDIVNFPVLDGDIPNTQLQIQRIQKKKKKKKKNTLIQSIKYAANIVLIWVLFYWRRFDVQQAHGTHMLTWGNHKRFLHVLMIDCHAHNFVTCKELVRPIQVFNLITVLQDKQVFVIYQDRFVTGNQKFMHISYPWPRRHDLLKCRLSLSHVKLYSNESDFLKIRKYKHQIVI